MQRPKFVFVAISAQNRFLRLPRLSQYRFRLAIDERVQLGIPALDTIKVNPSHLDRRNRFAADLRRNLPRGKKKMRA